MIFFFISEGPRGRIGAGKIGGLTSLSLSGPDIRIYSSQFGIRAIKKKRVVTSYGQKRFVSQFRVS